MGDYMTVTFNASTTSGLSISADNSGNIAFQSNGNSSLTIDTNKLGTFANGLSVVGNVTLATLTPTSSNLAISGNTCPTANATYDLGTSTLRWRTVYTTDLELNNGIGDYTVVEGADDLFLYNNRSGKVFKFALIEVDPATAPPKAKR